MDSYAVHKRIEVRDWLAANPRIKVHFTPTSGPWAEEERGLGSASLNRQAIRRGGLTSVRGVMIEIRAFING